METFFLFLAFSPRLPTFINFRTKEFQSHHKADCVLHAHAHVAVELSVLAINENLWRYQISKKDKQHNGEAKHDKRARNDLQNTTQKTRDRATRTSLKLGVNPEMISSSCSTSGIRRIFWETIQKRYTYIEYVITVKWVTHYVCC